MNNIVTGVVEVVMPNKFDKEKIAMKIQGDDRWFNQKREFLDAVPNRGDKVSFSSGKEEGQKYIQGIRILEKAEGAPVAKGKGGGFNSLGVELGHAANNAVAILVSKGKAFTLEDVKAGTKAFYAMMKDLREEYEAGEVEEKPVKKASKPKKEPVEEEFDDDFPF